MYRNYRPSRTITIALHVPLSCTASIVRTCTTVMYRNRHVDVFHCLWTGPDACLSVSVQARAVCCLVELNVFLRERLVVFLFVLHVTRNERDSICPHSVFRSSICTINVICFSLKYGEVLIRVCVCVDR